MSFTTRYLAIAAALMLGACATTSTSARFYTLSTLAEPAAAPTHGTSPLRVEIMPVQVPERLARPQIVVRTNAASAQVRILEHERWSSPFDYELHDAFASAIMADLAAIGASRESAAARSYRIGVKLVQFDALPDDHLQTRFSWSVQRSDDGITASCQTATSRTISNGISGLVQGMQQAVNNTAQQISAAITALEAGNSAPCTHAASQ